MDNNGIKITTRDRLLKAWQDSTELVRDYQYYYHETNDNYEVAKTFAEYAEHEALHAAKLLELLQDVEKRMNET